MLFAVTDLCRWILFSGTDFADENG